jgi:hypothetical protein
MQSPTRIKGAAAAVVAMALPLAACGSSKPSTQSAATKRASAVALANCMRANGVPNFPDPSGTNGGGIQIQQSARSGSGPSTAVNGVPVNGPAFQAAMRKCHSYLPNGGHPPPGGLAAVRKKALQFARCMRAHGISNFPDPQVSSGPGGGVGIRIGGPGSGLDSNSPAFKSAQQACGSLIGKAPGPATAAAP